MSDKSAIFDLWNIKEQIKLWYNEDSLDKDVLALLLVNEMDIKDQEFSLNVSTSNDQADWTDQSSWGRLKATATTIAGRHSSIHKTHKQWKLNF